MMTFGLNRPVYSFGLVAAATVIIIGGTTLCSIPIRDSRDFFAEHEPDFQVTDVRVQYETEGRRGNITDIRSWAMSDDRLLLIGDERVFVVEEDRVFYIERDCNDV